MRITGRNFTGLFILSASLMLIVVGCRPSGTRAPRRDKLVRIVLIGEAQDEPAWSVVEAVGAQFARNYPLTVVESRAPPTASPKAQQELLAALVDEEIDAVCVHPTDPLTLTQQIDVLSQRGQSVVVIGRDAPASRRDAYCGPSEFEIGKTAVRGVARIISERSGTLMLLHAGTEGDSYAKRYYGFKQGLSQSSGLEVLREVDCRGVPLDAVRLVRAESRRYPRIGCWVFLDDWALRTLRDDDSLLPLGGTIVLCNGSPRYFDHVRDGRIPALIAYDLQKTIEEGLLAAVRLAEERTSGFAPLVDVPPEIITVKELPAYEDRWKRWQRGEPTPPTKP